MKRTPATSSIAAITAILLSGAIFGFFYAWVCSTMWGLDEADPRVAIEAMQAMNASVRNAVFFPAFFLTPLALAGVGGLIRRPARTASTFFFAAATFSAAGVLVTGTVNVPMNNELGATVIPGGIEEARAIWDAYSGRWQLWNGVRTATSGTALLLAVIGLRHLTIAETRRDTPAADPQAAHA